MKTVAYTLMGNLFISVHGKLNVSEGEFPQVLQVFRRLEYSMVRMLVITDGGGPTPVQRKEMNSALSGREMPTAVMSNDIVIRGTVTALSWFNKKIRSFPLSELDEALEYLDVSSTKFEAIQHEVESLRAELQNSKTRGATVGR